MVEKITLSKPAENHPAIQNLRWFLRDFTANGGNVKTFAQRMGVGERRMGAYLRGYYKPKEVTIRHWAMLLGVDYEYMMTVEFEHIPYPFHSESKKKKSGRHITMDDVDEKFKALESDCMKVCEDHNIEYEAVFKPLFDKHSNHSKKPTRRYARGMFNYLSFKLMELSTKSGRIFIDYKETEQGGRYVKVTQSRKNKETEQYEAHTIFLSENETREFAALMQQLVESLPEAENKEGQEGQEGQEFKKWTAEEEKTLRNHFEEGQDVPALSKLVDRSERAIWYRLKKMGLIGEIPAEFILKEEQKS